MEGGEVANALCLFSGGRNSTVALAWAVANYPRVATVSLNYPSRPALERVAAREIAARYLVRHIEIDASFLAIAKEVDESPHAGGSRSQIRVLVFHAIALSIAEQIEADVVVAGNAQSDGSTFRNAEGNYITQIYDMANRMVEVSGRHSAVNAVLQLPLINKPDWEITELGQSLSAPLEFSSPA
jgi:7-cyano-7-deazaguanine synthase in queuosine biosynthesis